MRIYTLILFLAVVLLTKAQEEVPELVTDRPDQTESATVIPLKTLQIESGFVMEVNETNLLTNKAFAYNTTLLRYGLLRTLELRMGLAYLANKIKITETHATEDISGWSPLYLGFKVQILKEEGMPEVAFIAGVELPFVAQEDYKSDYTAGDFRFSVAHSINQHFSVGYNLGVQWDGNTSSPAYFYSLVLGANITNKLGAYAEVFGLLPEVGESAHQFDGGFTYLALDNLQFDVSAGVGLNSSAPDYFISLGLTYRLPY